MLASVLLVAMVPGASAANDQVLWGAHIQGAPMDPRLIDAFEARANKRAALVHWGEAWSHAGSYLPFQTSYFQAVRDRGSIPVLDWASWDYCCSEHQPQFNLSVVSSGAHDAYIAEWARAAAAWGHPFFLRLNPEMNGWWRPWSEQTNGNKSGDYVRAWRHVVDIFRAQGASNVTWVWCPNIVGPRSTPMAGLYPGDNYVDWTCMDGYNWGTDRKNDWQSFNEVFAGSWFNGGFNTYQLLLDTAPSKPIMIGETAASEDGGNKAAWISDMLLTQLPQNFPHVRALIWFDWNEGDPTLDWPIASSPTAQRAFVNGIASTYYATNQFATLEAGQIPARLPVVVAPAVVVPAPMPAEPTAMPDEPLPAEPEESSATE
jgi:hypothetical protein